MLRVYNLPIRLLILVFALAPQSVFAQSASAWIHAPRGANPGSLIDITVLMQSGRQLGGLDFTIHYNDSIFSFHGVDQDTGLNNWEYFTSSHDTVLNTVNIFSIADVQNGTPHPDSLDFYPKGVIARYTFFVAPNWISDSAREEFSFYWKICGDNAASNRKGDTLILLDRVFAPNGTLVWDETDNVNFPESLRLEHIGAPDSCLTASDKVLFSLNFRSAFATNYYVCGDADGNDALSISDAVRLINYIFAGAAEPNPLQSGDVDCNSFISISDIVYLINYIFAGGNAPCAACQQ